MTENQASIPILNENQAVSQFMNEYQAVSKLLQNSKHQTKPYHPFQAVSLKNVNFNMFLQRICKFSLFVKVQINTEKSIRKKKIE